MGGLLSMMMDQSFKLKNRWMEIFSLIKFLPDTLFFPSFLSVSTTGLYESGFTFYNYNMRRENTVSGVK